MPAAPITTAPGRQRFTDDDLLDTARDVFSRRGYHAAQMSEIAARAATTKPTLYARLGSKQQIYLAVLAREAAALTGYLYDAYKLTAGRPMHEMVEIANLALFRFAEQHRVGFELLFRDEPSAPGTGTGERVMNEVTDRVSELVASVLERSGRRAGPSSSLIAAAGVGVARQVCQYALEHRLDLPTAGTLASAFTAAAMRGLDPRLIAEADRDASARRSGR